MTGVRLLPQGKIERIPACDTSDTPLAIVPISPHLAALLHVQHWG